MIFYLRRYLLTVVTLIVTIVWDTHVAVGIAGVATALLLDVFVSSRSKDLLLYRNELNFSVPAPLMSFREALRLQAIAIVAGPLVAVLPRAFGGDATVQQIFSVAAMLICGSIASYCGLFGRRDATRELLNDVRTTTGEIGLLGIDFLPPYPRAFMAGLLRIFLAPFMMFFFLLMLAALHTIAVDLKVALLLIAAASLFQVGFLLFLIGLFTLHWRRRPNDFADQQPDEAR